MTAWAEDLLLGGGYVLLALLILLENLFPPIPSELLLPLAGSRVASGDFDYLGAVAAATVGSVAGALILYAAGRLGGRPLLLRHGRILRLDERRLDRADDWFDTHGSKLVLFGRMIPGVRSVVSVPAGLSEMPIGRFVALTALGSAVWNAAADRRRLGAREPLARGHRARREPRRLGLRRRRRGDRGRVRRAPHPPRPLGPVNRRAARPAPDAIFEAFAATGAPPEPARLARPARARGAPRRRARRRRRGSGWRTRSPPTRDGARVDAGGRTWWGNCAWDGFGIVHALGLPDATVTAQGIAVDVAAACPTRPAPCSASPCPPRAGGTTSATPERRCGSSGRRRRRTARRSTLRTLAALARDWYGDRLDPAWRPRSAEESQRILGAHGLTGAFWRLG